MSKSTLKSILNVTGSQCKGLRTGVVTKPTRREACGSICKALLRGRGHKQAGSNIGKQVYKWQDKEYS